METSLPDLEVAKQFAEAIHAEHPDQLLAYNCSPSFNWRKHLDDDTIAKFQRELGAMGYKFQFITLAGFHALNYSMFDLAHGYAREQMKAYVDLQEREFAAEERGYTATKHQREVGTGYFDLVSTAVNPELDPGPVRFDRGSPVPLSSAPHLPGPTGPAGEEPTDSARLDDVFTGFASSVRAEPPHSAHPAPASSTPQFLTALGKSEEKDNVPHHDQRT